MGTGFHAEPEGLKHTAKHDIGKLIDHTHTARGKIAETQQFDGQAFAGHVEVYEAAGEWYSARSMLLNVFSRNEENLVLAQEALVEVAELHRRGLGQRADTRRAPVMSWAADMQKHADYFCKKFDEQEDWYFPDHLEKNASHPTAKEDIQRMFGEFARFIDVDSALVGVREEISLLAEAADDIDQDFCEGVLNDVDLYLENWEGDAADGFRSYLCGQPSIEGALARKRDVVRAAKYAMQAYEKAITSFRDDVPSLVEAGQKGVQAGEIRDAKIMITLASAAVSIGVAAVSAGTGAAYLATIAVGDALQTGAAGVNSTVAGGEQH